MWQVYISHLCRDSELLELLKTAPVGIETIEFSIGDNLDRGKQAIRDYKKRIPDLSEYPLMIHGPFLDLNPVSFDSKIARASRERFCETLQIARELRAKGVIFHSCFIPNTNYTIGWPERQIRFWQEMMDQYAGELWVYLENVYDPQWQPLLEIARGVKRERFGICLDVGHVHAYSGQTAKEWIENLGTCIKHLHLHDNHGTKDEHLALGQGTLKLPELFELVEKYTQVQGVTIENVEVEAIQQSLEILKEYGSCLMKICKSR